MHTTGGQATQQAGDTTMPNANLPNVNVCPTCHTCPTCGRVTYVPVVPYTPYVPYYPNQWICGNN